MFSRTLCEPKEEAPGVQPEVSDVYNKIDLVPHTDHLLIVVEKWRDCGGSVAVCYIRVKP